VPESAHADYHALDVLQNILFIGNSSRLYRRLVDKDELAIEIDTHMGLALDPTLLMMIIQPREGVSTDAVEKALYEELERMQRDGVTDRELQKARNAILAEFYRTLKTIDGKGQALGNYEIFFGDYRRLFRVAEDVARVSAADVQRVAKKYLRETNRTVATLIPAKEEGGDTAPSGRAEKEARP
jgi:predicted Zn-dependent peptidase